MAAIAWKVDWNIMASSLLTYTLKRLASQCGPGQRAGTRLARGLAIGYSEHTDGTARLALSRRGETWPSSQEVQTVLEALHALGWPMRTPTVNEPKRWKDSAGRTHSAINIDIVWLDTSF